MTLDFSWTPELLSLQAEATEVGRQAAASLPVREDSWIVGTSRSFSLTLAERGWLGMTWPVDEGGVSVVGELYDVPLDTLRDRFIPAEPDELELSVIELDDGSSAVAVVLRRESLNSPELTDISDRNGWRAYRSGATTTP